jgi:hypothetical protein
VDPVSGRTVYFAQYAKEEKRAAAGQGLGWVPTYAFRDVKDGVTAPHASKWAEVLFSPKGSGDSGGRRAERASSVRREAFVAALVEAPSASSSAAEPGPSQRPAAELSAVCGALWYALASAGSPVLAVSETAQKLKAAASGSDALEYAPFARWLHAAHAASSRRHGSGASSVADGAAAVDYEGMEVGASLDRFPCFLRAPQRLEAVLDLSLCLEHSFLSCTSLEERALNLLFALVYV